MPTAKATRLPPVAEALEQHAEESHARQMAAIPLRWPAEIDAEDDDSREARDDRRRRKRPQFVLVAEQFDARGDCDRDRLVEVAEVCTTALYNALEFDRLPLSWLLRPLGAVKQQVVDALAADRVSRWPPSPAAVAALVLVPADFNIEAPGTLQPVVRRDVFAPRSGLVDEVLVAHGAEVAAGQPLVRMRDPSLDLELKRVDGELETAQRQLDAVRATQDQPRRSRRQPDRRLSPLGRGARAAAAAHEFATRAGIVEPRARAACRHQPDRRPRAHVGRRPSA